MDADRCPTPSARKPPRLARTPDRVCRNQITRRRCCKVKLRLNRPGATGSRPCARNTHASCYIFSLHVPFLRCYLRGATLQSRRKPMPFDSTLIESLPSVEAELNYMVPMAEK